MEVLALIFVGVMFIVTVICLSKGEEGGFFVAMLALVLFGVGATASAESNKEPKPTEQQVIINLTPEEYNALIQENSKE